MLQFDWLNQYCTLYIRPILQYIARLLVYVESREESNEHFGTLAQLGEKPQSSNGYIECCNLYVESREESNEPIFGTLAQLVEKTTVI